MKENHNNVAIHHWHWLFSSSSVVVVVFVVVFVECISVCRLWWACISVCRLLCYFCAINIFSSEAIVMKTSANVTFLRSFCWMKVIHIHSLPAREWKNVCCWFGHNGIFIVVCRHSSAHTHFCHRCIIIVISMLQKLFALKSKFYWSRGVCDLACVWGLGACAFGGFYVWFFFLISCNDRQLQTNSHSYVVHIAQCTWICCYYDMDVCNAVAFFPLFKLGKTWYFHHMWTSIQMSQDFIVVVIFCLCLCYCITHSWLCAFAVCGLDQWKVFISTECVTSEMNNKKVKYSITHLCCMLCNSLTVFVLLVSLSLYLTVTIHAKMMIEHTHTSTSSRAAALCIKWCDWRKFLLLIMCFDILKSWQQVTKRQKRTRCGGMGMEVVMAIKNVGKIEHSHAHRTHMDRKK